MAFGNVIARLAVSLNLDTVAFEKGATLTEKRVSQMQRKFADMGKRFAVGAAAIGAAGGVLVSQFRDMASNAIQSAKEIEQLAQVANAGVEEFQKAAFAAKSLGIESDKLADIYKDVNDKVGDFLATGGGEMADFFENIAPKVGVTAEQFRKLSGPQALQLYVSSLEKAGLSQQEMTFYMEAVANDATMLLPLMRDNGKAMGEFAEKAEELGLVLSSEEIAKAKEVANNLALLNAKIEAQQNKKLLENAESIMKFEEGLSNLKLALINGVVEFDKFYTNVQRSTYNFGRSIEAAVNAIPAAINRMVSDIGNAIGGRLTAIWDRAKAKVEEVRQTFWNLWDKVTRRSYVPDMVDDIQREMIRLDTVMVDKAKTTTQTTAEKFKQMASDVRSILDELYPEAARLNAIADKRAIIAGSDLPAELKEDADYRLRRQRAGLPDKFDLPVSQRLLDTKPLDEGFKKLEIRLKGFGDTARTQTVRVARTFQDMAQSALDSLSRLTSALKGGGFLGILEGVIGLGLQLGSTGLFGKKIATNLNRIEARANGGPVTAGRPYLVGERGPELVVPRQNSRVISNDNLAMGGKLQIEVVANNNGFGAFVRNEAGMVVAQAAGPIANAGSAGAQMSLARSRKRSMA